MILRRLVLGVIGLALAGAAAATAVVAAAFAVYALLRDSLTPAGAAGAVVGFTAVTAAVGAFIVFRQIKAPKGAPLRRGPVAADGSIGRLVEVFRERPVVSAAAAAAVGLLAVANPAIVTAVIRAFTDQKPRR